MGKGGSNEIQETEAQKAAASVAMEQWDLYKNDLQKYEDIFIEKVDALNSEGEFDNWRAPQRLAPRKLLARPELAWLIPWLPAGQTRPVAGTRRQWKAWQLTRH